jgi:hypothetical protein
MRVMREHIGVRSRHSGSHTVDMHIARLVEELMYVEGVHHLAAYLGRREIRRLTLERGSIAAVYVEHHGQASYEAMRSTCRVLWILIREYVMATGTHNTALYRNALAAASTAQTLGLPSLTYGEMRATVLRP